MLGRLSPEIRNQIYSCLLGEPCTIHIEPACNLSLKHAIENKSHLSHCLCKETGSEKEAYHIFRHSTNVQDVKIVPSTHTSFVYNYTEDTPTLAHGLSISRSHYNNLPGPRHERCTTLYPKCELIREMQMQRNQRIGYTKYLSAVSQAYEKADSNCIASPMEIALSSSLISAEYLSMFYGHHLFAFTDPVVFDQFIGALRRNTRTQLRKVLLCMNFYPLKGVLNLSEWGQYATDLNGNSLSWIKWNNSLLSRRTLRSFRNLKEIHLCLRHLPASSSEAWDGGRICAPIDDPGWRNKFFEGLCALKGHNLRTVTVIVENGGSDICELDPKLIDRRSFSDWLRCAILGV
jgi:hypothetical protein